MSGDERSKQPYAKRLSASLEINDLKESIEFDNVHFGYGSEEIIKGITFEVKKGEKVAIIGPTGAGKSTIVKLLIKFYNNYKDFVSEILQPILQIKLGIVTMFAWDNRTDNGVTDGYSIPSSR